MYHTSNTRAFIYNCAHYALLQKNLHKRLKTINTENTEVNKVNTTSPGYENTVPLILTNQSEINLCLYHWDLWQCQDHHASCSRHVKLPNRSNPEVPGKGLWESEVTGRKSGWDFGNTGRSS